MGRVSWVRRQLSTFKRTFVRPFAWSEARISQLFPFLRPQRVRFGLIGLVAAFVAGEFVLLILPLFPTTAYALGDANRLLTEQNSQMAAKVKFDKIKRTFSFNDTQMNGSNDGNTGLTDTNQAKVTAHEDASKGVTVDDPSTTASFSMTPLFKTSAGRQDGNRIVYPLRNGQSGWVVYSMHAVGVKEDIVLTKSPGPSAEYSFKLGLSPGQEARLEADGSLGVYGNALFAGTIAAGSEKDAKLLEKARQNAPKNKRLFNIPAPVVV